MFFIFLHEEFCPNENEKEVSSKYNSLEIYTSVTIHVDKLFSAT